MTQPTGYAERMARSWCVDPQAWDDLLKPMATEMIVGATQAHPGVFPDGFGIGRRDEPRNEYLGLVTTWPDGTTFVLGLNYHDRTTAATTRTCTRSTSRPSR